MAERAGSRSFLADACRVGNCFSVRLRAKLSAPAAKAPGQRRGDVPPSSEPRLRRDRTRSFRYAKRMDDKKSQPDENALQEKIAAEFEKTIVSSEASLRLLDPMHEMFSFVEDIRRELSARAAEAQQIAESFVATAGKVAAAIADSLTEASMRFKELLGYSEHVAKLGWTLDPNLPFPEALHLSTLTRRADADAYVLKSHEEDDPKLEHMERDLRAERVLAQFDTVLQQCFESFRNGQYAICIPTLMNALEGVARELDPPHINSTDLRKMLKKGGSVAKRAEHDMLTAAIWLSLATFINDLYEPWTALATKPAPALSRHLTQHGRKEPPNEKVEVIRLLHAIETALSLHRELGTSVQVSSQRQVQSAQAS